MTFKIIYTAKAPHQCDLPYWKAGSWMDLPEGSITVCEECGAAWIRDRSHWRMVKPWPFDRKARKILKARGER